MFVFALLVSSHGREVTIYIASLVIVCQEKITIARCETVRVSLCVAIVPRCWYNVGLISGPPQNN